jgi:hypothetical protein
MSESSLAFPRGEVMCTCAQSSVRRISRSLEWIVGNSSVTLRQTGKLCFWLAPYFWSGRKSWRLQAPPRRLP